MDSAATPGFFDFIRALPYYAETNLAVERMNKRHRFVIDPFRADIAGARVLDLAAHDGRWAYAFAGAGADSVLGIEGRQELIDMYRDFPETPFKGRVTLRQGDIFAGVEAEIAAGRTYDVIGVLGIFYHIADHVRLLDLLRRLRPRLVIVDSEFYLSRGALIRLHAERTDLALNAIRKGPVADVAAVGVPTFQAMEMMARCTGFGIDWLDWATLRPDDQDGVRDYYVPSKKRPKILRATCALRPLP